MDVSRPPIGERQRRAILDAIVAAGDVVENHYLEVKRELDVTNKDETPKIAKFILGAANRQPSVAAQKFAGYAVMVIGAEAGGLPGVPAGTEILDVEQKIGKFLLPDSPKWELERAPADDDGREVLFILVDPPQDGDPIHVCRGNHQGAKGATNLNDGDIFIRIAGATKKATAVQVDALMARAAKLSKADPELTVDLVGEANYLDDSTESLETYIPNQIEDARRRYVETPVSTKSFNIFPQIVAPPLLGMPPSSLSSEAFTRKADAWERKTRSSWRNNLNEMAGYALSGLVVKLGNIESSFLEGVRLELTLEKARGLQAFDIENLDLDKFFPPVIEKSDPFGYRGIQASLMRSFIPGTHISYPLTWKDDGENLRITVELKDLRPGSPWISDGDDFVVVAREKTASSISGSWRATARGYDKAFEGTVTVPIGKPHDVRSLHTLLEAQEPGHD